MFLCGLLILIFNLIQYYLLAFHVEEQLIQMSHLEKVCVTLLLRRDWTTIWLSVCRSRVSNSHATVVLKPLANGFYIWFGLGLKAMGFWHLVWLMALEEEKHKNKDYLHNVNLYQVNDLGLNSSIKKKKSRKQLWIFLMIWWLHLLLNIDIDGNVVRNIIVSWPI